MRQEDVSRLGLTRVSDLTTLAPGWRAGFGYAFLNRPDGFQGLAARYGLRFAQALLAMDLGLTYRALADGVVDVIVGDATNGLIDSLKPCGP